MEVSAFFPTFQAVSPAQVDLLRQRAGPGKQLEEILPRHARVIRARYEELLQDQWDAEGETGPMGTEVD